MVPGMALAPVKSAKRQPGATSQFVEVVSRSPTQKKAK